MHRLQVISLCVSRTDAFAQFDLDHTHGSYYQNGASDHAEHAISRRHQYEFGFCILI
jgi:hypothetical protein